MSRLFHYKLRIGYRQTELVNSIDEIKHPIVKAALQLLEIDEPLEIISMADIPAQTGLGSSSSFTVGLLHALHAFKGNLVDAENLARQACEIEINMIGDPIGKQDQYAAAYGGLLKLDFNQDGTVITRRISLSEQRRVALEQRLMMFYLGGTRSAADILRKQSAETGKRLPVMRDMRDMAAEAAELLESDKPLAELGSLLHRAWEAKRTLTNGITSELIDTTYAKARKAGALGGKLLGAGGQGFFLFYVEPENQEAVRAALKQMPQEIFKIAPQGTTVIYKSQE